MGHVLGIGSLVTSRSILTLWHDPLLTFFGGIDIASRASGKPVHGFLTMPPISGFISATSLSPTSVGWDAPRARSVLSWEPNKFIAKGISLISPLGKRGFSNKTAGPFVFTRRSAMAPASSSTSTGSDMRSNSPFSSKWASQRVELRQAMLVLGRPIHEYLFCSDSFKSRLPFGEAWRLATSWLSGLARAVVPPHSTRLARV